MLAVHYNLENSLVSILTENAERDTEAKRYYEQPEGGSSGLIVRNQLNLNGGQDQDLGGRYGLEASAAWATGARRSTCNWPASAVPDDKLITRSTSCTPSANCKAVSCAWAISPPIPKG